MATTELYRAKWTDQIHEEWIRNVLLNRQDLKRKQLERTKQLMNENVLNCLVEDYEYLIPTLKLPDENDKHVLAAAIKSSASTIVTYNLKDFPTKHIESFRIEAQHPDKFISRWIDSHPGVVCTAISKLRNSLKNPPISASRYLEILTRQSLPQTVAKLREFIEII